MRGGRLLLLSLAVWLSVGVASALAADPAPPPVATTAPEATIAPGVTMVGIDVGGLTLEQAVAKVEPAFAAPIVVHVGNRTFTYRPGYLKQDARVRQAMAKAFAATSGQDVSIYVAYDAAKVRTIVDFMVQKTTKDASDAEWLMNGREPDVKLAVTGREVDAKALRYDVIRALQRPLSRTLKEARTPVEPAVGNADLPPAIVIDRNAHHLTLFKVGKLGKVHVVRIIGVAVGQPIYPTPAGLFHIVDMQRNPWWYPPDSAWAQGEEPIPPGPTNPLGTRWMGISAPGVGMHGTPNPASIGYSASHGCIRLRIPDAEWLFNHVELGVPVRIV